MATTILSAFEQLRSKLEITGLQRSTVSTRQQNVRKAVEDYMTVIDSFLTGSYVRNTMIAPLSKADIDIFMVLHPTYFTRGKPTQVLEQVREVLLKTYTRTPEISRNGQAVTITFNDFMVDVVPAFERREGVYVIPDSIQGNWISTNPKVHTEAIALTNAVHNGDFVPLVKMIKGWHRIINSPFFSFYLELLADKIFRNINISNYPSGIRFFSIKGGRQLNTRSTILLILEDS